jgi:hypothetical protein
MDSNDSLDAVARENGFTLKPSREVRNFRSLEDLLLFFEHEASFWKAFSCSEVSKWGEQIDSEIANIKYLVRNPELLNREAELRNHIGRVQNNCAVFSPTEQAAWLKRIDQLDPLLVPGALSLYTQDHVDRNQWGIAGMVIGTVLKKPTIIPALAEARLDQFENLARDAKQLVSQTERHLAKFREELTAEWAERTNITEGKISNWEEKYDKHWGGAKRRTAELEELYERKLQLSAPCDYWKKLEGEYSRKGHGWAFASVGIGAAIFWAARGIVYQPPEILKSPEFTLGGLKGALILTVGFSIAVYLVTLLVRLATSAYHLAADARERRQLTYVYLALTKEEGAMKDEDRRIVLTSIFSRAETGLLKSDGAPTFPTPLGSLLDAVRK